MDKIQKPGETPTRKLTTTARNGSSTTQAHHTTACAACFGPPICTYYRFFVRLCSRSGDTKCETDTFARGNSQAEKAHLVIDAALQGKTSIGCGGRGWGCQIVCFFLRFTHHYTRGGAPLKFREALQQNRPLNRDKWSCHITGTPPISTGPTFCSISRAANPKAAPSIPAHDRVSGECQAENF
jgi:hypothetical protein